MGYALLKEKPLLGPKIDRPPKSARERAASRWGLKEKPQLTVRIASDKTLPGQYYDVETNLHYNHFRYYDSTLGRYITSDPIGLLGGSNSYVYVGQNSLRSYDPYGLERVADWIGFLVEPVAGIDIGDHYERNINQPNPPPTVNDLNNGETRDQFTNIGETGTHNVGTSGNQDYRGNPGGQYEGHQYIYDSIGNLVTNPLNVGTYDTVSPVNTLDVPSHFRRDVISWLAWGNAPNDPSTTFERLRGLLGVGGPGNDCD